jgi:hypothetical protein
MTGMRSGHAVRSTGERLRRRLMSRSDVKGAARPGRSQNRSLMRGGRA